MTRAVQRISATIVEQVYALAWRAGVIEIITSEGMVDNPYRCR
jgi:hypothetical protein